MKTKLLYIILLFPLVITAQSNDRNWVKQTIYTDENLGNPKVNVTYLDGFGRPIQQNAFQQAADDSGKDIITNFEYDDFGRQVKSNLPLSAASNAMLFIDGLTSSVQYPNQDAFSQKEFESSPLNRVIKIAAPGDSNNWSMGSNNEIEMQYQANTTADAVRYFKSLAPEFELLESGTFPENILYKTVVTDENNNVTQEFKNTKGQLVLKRSFNNGTTIDTYYVYDDFGNLIFVIPPKVTDINVASLRDLCYQYHYDAKNRLIEKKVPGKQWEYIVYDALNRIVATGPAYHPFGSDDSEMGWLYNRYDNQNRVVMTGWFSADFSESNRNSPDHSNLRELMQGEYNGEIFNSSRILSAQNIDGIDVYYSIDNYVPSDLLLLSVTYYDDHQGFNTPQPIDFSTPFNNVYYDSSTNEKKPKGLPTCSWVRTLVDRNGPIVGETSYVLYDYRGNPVVSHLFNFKGGYTRTISKFDFSGKIVETRTFHKLEDTAPQIAVNQKFDYTNQGLLLRQKHQINDPLQDNAPWVTLAENKYDALGRLVAKLTGKIGADFLQQIDYQYNIRGWLTSINNIDNLAARPGAPDDAQNIDLFSYKINYDEVDPLFTGATGYFNGNISETYWRTATDNTVRKYSYQYDSLNRMTKAIYQKPDATNPVRDSYNEQVSYDKNGNITSLSRNGDLDINGTTVEIDNMTYQYQSALSNRLVSLGDGTNSDAGYKDGDVPVNIEYVYDRNGNLIVDKNKQITSIVYNHLNLPTEIIFEGNTSKKITYIYSASGEKVQKAYITPPMTEQRVTNYMGGFQYFKNVLQFIASSEGYVSAVSSGEGYQYNYVYQYKDHLGNVRLSYGRDTQSPFAVRILEENHYYPYGLKHTNYNLDLNAYRSDTDGRVVLTGNEISSDMVNKYKFSNREYQDELGLNTYAMDFRQYDPSIGRFNSMDALSERNYSSSPFAFAHNNPIYWTDPSGLDGIPGWIMSIFNNSGTGTTNWSNDGGGTFSTQNNNLGSGGMVDTATGGFTAFESLAEVTVYANSHGRWDSSAIGTIQSHVYWTANAYAGWRIRQRGAAMDDFQSGLDWLGAIPGIGEPIDLLNAGISGARGNYGTAALSLAAMVPVAGWAATGLKQSHHIIPRAVFRDMAGELGDVMKLNGANNLMDLPVPFHLGGHKSYNDFVKSAIQELKNQGPLSPGSIEALQGSLKGMINEGLDAYHTTGANLSTYFKQF